jgi:hypothetical protein
METEKPKTEPADLLGTALPETNGETNGDLQEIRRWWRWSKMTWRVVGGLFVLAAGFYSVFRAIEEFLKLFGMLLP